MPLVLLDRDASNIPLVAACAMPVGPALSAALYALRRRGPDLTDLHPAPGVPARLPSQFSWRAETVGAVAGLGDDPRDQHRARRWWTGPLVVVAVVAALWQANALVIASLFEFRARDTARLAAYFLVRTFRVTLANLGLAVIAALVTALWSEAVLALMAALFAAGLLHAARPVRCEIEERFVR